MFFTKCDVCKITLSKNDFPIHMKGKRHQKRVEINTRHGKPITNLSEDGVAVKFESNRAAQTRAKPTAVASVKTTPNPAIPVKTILNPATPVKITPNTYAQSKAGGQNKPNKGMGKRKHEQSEAKCLVPPAKVDSRKPFDEQVNDFIAQVRQTENEHLNIQKVLRDVAYTFHSVMPNVIPVLYGSQATGLAFRTSDIDVYLCNPADIDEDLEFIKMHGRTIYKSRLFTSIRLVINARVPIIKAKHIVTGIELDISATSGQAVANSKLILFLMSHDDRIRKLMMLIGYCVKKYELISVSQFKRYSINLLIIFYLQNLEVPILPPLQKFVYGIPGKTWPFAINEDRTLLENKNNTPLEDLFVGFFSFYKDFLFDKEIISTYDGSKLNEIELQKPEVLERLFYYRICFMFTESKVPQKNICIQDPLLLYSNTTTGVSVPTLKQFVKLCQNIVEMKEKIQVKDWMTEILSGEVAKFVEDVKPLKKFTRTIFYEVKNGIWQELFGNDLIQALTYLGMNDCIRFHPIRSHDTFSCSLESSVFPFTPEYFTAFEFFKKEVISLNEFLKCIKPIINEFKINCDFRFRIKSDQSIVVMMTNRKSCEGFEKFCWPFYDFFLTVLTLKNIE